MKNPVIAIGLDSADPVLLETWIEQGYLKNLAQLRSQGSYGRLNNLVHYAQQTTPFCMSEPLWVIFNTGCLPDKTGYWSAIEYYKENYGVKYDNVNGGYNYQEFSPFYTNLKNKRIAVFDLPCTKMSQQVEGVQVLGWGGHSLLTPSESIPPHLLPELSQKYGKDPIYLNELGIWWHKTFKDSILEKLKGNIVKRSAICQDLLGREPWDLFLTVISDTHRAGHDLFGYGQSHHPLYPTFQKEQNSSDVLLEFYQQVDEEIGEILTKVSDDAYILVFSLHGMDANMADLFTMLFLPELLYRFNFGGQSAIAPGQIDQFPSPMITEPVRHSWLGEVWARNTPQNWIQKRLKSWTPSQFLRSPKNGLDCPFSLLETSDEDGLAWMPSRWYRPLWPKMKAFALPTFTDGQIRINLKGRDPKGIVEPSEYDSLCQQISQFLYQLVDARTKKPIVRKVIRTRQSPTEDHSKLPDGDLVVLWHETPTDVVDSPEFGRIGPVPYFRLGGHRGRGFLIAKGEGIEANSTFGSGQIVDLTPTILKLMNVPIPDYFDGQPLFNLHS